MRLRLEALPCRISAHRTQLPVLARGGRQERRGLRLNPAKMLFVAPLPTHTTVDLYFLLFRLEAGKGDASAG